MLTKEFLMKRVEGLNKQLHELVQQELMVRGAIQDTQDLIRFMDEEEKKGEPTNPEVQ